MPRLKGWQYCILKTNFSNDYCERCSCADINFFFFFRFFIIEHRWAVPRYFFSTGTVGTLEIKYRYRSAGTFNSQFLGGTRYFGKMFYNKKKRRLRSYSFRSNRLKDLFLKYNTAIPSSAAIERFFSSGKDILKLKRSGLLELDDLSQMVLFFERQFRVKVFQYCSSVSSVLFASPSVDKVFTIRESLVRCELTPKVCDGFLSVY